MSRLINRSTLPLCLCTPQQKYRRLRLFINERYNGISKALPAFTLMRIWLSALHRQQAVKKQYALLCPFRQVPACRLRAAQVIGKLLEYVL